MPNGREGLPNQRRSFFKSVTGFVSAALGGVVAIPGLRFLAHPAAHDTVSSGKQPLSTGVKPASIEAGQPRLVEIRGELRDAWSRIPDVKLGSCWLVKSPDDGKVHAFSSVCPHLGCGIDWNPDDMRFVCPCHDSFFAPDGKCLAGPSPRSMDELQVDVDVDVGDLKISYRRFRVGIPRKEEV